MGIFISFIKNFKNKSSLAQSQNKCNKTSLFELHIWVLNSITYNKEYEIKWGAIGKILGILGIYWQFNEQQNMNNKYPTPQPSLKE